MVHKNADMAHIIRENIRGGRGTAHTDMVFGPEDMHGKATLFNRMTLEPGTSIGEHPHEQDAEIYYVLKGSVTVYDCGTPHKLEEGDAMFTCCGESHRLVNDSGDTAVILAIVIA